MQRHEKAACGTWSRGSQVRRPSHPPDRGQSLRRRAGQLRPEGRSEWPASRPDGARRTKPPSRRHQHRSVTAGIDVRHPAFEPPAPQSICGWHLMCRVGDDQVFGKAPHDGQTVARLCVDVVPAHRPVERARAVSTCVSPAAAAAATKLLSRPGWVVNFNPRARCSVM